MFLPQALCELYEAARRHVGWLPVALGIQTPLG
jgi:hypothetical protein